MLRNPFTSRGMIRSETRFWGRELETRQIYSLLLDSEEEPQSVAVVGLRRIGKSSLLYRVAQKRGALSMYQPQLDCTTCLMLSMQAFAGACVEDFYSELLCELGQDRRIGDLLSTAVAHDSTDPEQRLSQVLGQMDREGWLLVLLLDEFECAAANPRFDKDFFDRLRALAQKRRLAYVVATQVDLIQLWDPSLISSPYSSPFFNFFQTATLSGFHGDEIGAYVTASLDNTGISFADWESQLVLDVAGSHPFFANVAAYHLFQAHAERGELPASDRDGLWMSITQDPTVAANFAYYWGNLTSSRRQVLRESTARGLVEPMSSETRVDVGWLERRGLLDRQEDGVYRPFSRAFAEFVFLQHEDQRHGTAGGHTLNQIIAESEGVAVEYKSSLRWDYHQGKTHERIEFAVLKTLAAFMNTQGGTLIVGVDDDGKVLGLEKDYGSLRKKDREGFQLHLIDLVSRQIGKSFCHLLTISFHATRDGDICVVAVQQAPEPAYLGEEASVFIRTGNATQALNPKEAPPYINRNWGWDHVQSFLGLADGDLPQDGKIVPGRENEMLDRFEWQIRALIDSILSAEHPRAYWKQTIPAQVQQGVKERIGDHLSRRPDQSWAEYASGRSRLDFCDVADYEAIVLSKGNWPRFEPIFSRRGEFERHISAIRRFRNTVKHGRPNDEVERLGAEAGLLWFRRVLGKESHRVNISGRELPSPEGDAPTFEDYHRLLTRTPIPLGQRQLYKALYGAGAAGLTHDQLVETMGLQSRRGLGGVLGALGNRVNATPGYGQRRKPAGYMVLSWDRAEDGQQRIRLLSGMRDALEQLNPDWLHEMAQ